MEAYFNLQGFSYAMPSYTGSEQYSRWFPPGVKFVRIVLLSKRPLVIL